MRLLAILWIFLVSAVLLWYGLRRTDKYFWQGVGWGLLVVGCTAITVWAVHEVTR